jgi:hypothetical protein
MISINSEGKIIADFSNLDSNTPFEQNFDIIAETDLGKKGAKKCSLNVKKISESLKPVFYGALQRFIVKDEA